MLGWEFPPFFAGGVGMVCYELTKELALQGIHIDYLMPKMPHQPEGNFLHVLDASSLEPSISIDELSSNIRTISVPGLLSAYQSSQEYQELKKMVEKKFSSILANVKNDTTNKLYGEDLLEEIHIFAQRVKHVCKKLKQTNETKYTVIHGHDWTTLLAGINAKEILNIPFIAHVHITEYNKNPGQGINTQVFEVEKEGFSKADKIIAVSNNIKQTLIEQYGVSGNKIEVVHNGGVEMAPIEKRVHALKEDGSKVVSFMGRITAMKGPENFVEMAKKVLTRCPKTKFIIAGTGDKLHACIQKVNELGMDDKFYFHGFYTRDEAEMLYDISDVFILPSLMEPFGVTPLEAMQKQTPVIVSKQSGVSEVINHCLKVDFWDVDKMASHVISLLSFPVLHEAISEHGFLESKKMDWVLPAKKCISLYEKIGLSQTAGGER
jgi:glycogen synthase